MVLVVLTMLVCLLVSAGVALFVAYTARGRPLPTARPADGRRTEEPADQDRPRVRTEHEARS